MTCLFEALDQIKKITKRKTDTQKKHKPETKKKKTCTISEKKHAAEYKCAPVVNQQRTTRQECSAADVRENRRDNYTSVSSPPPSSLHPSHNNKESATHKQTSLWFLARPLSFFFSPPLSQTAPTPRGEEKRLLSSRGLHRHLAGCLKVQQSHARCVKKGYGQAGHIRSVSLSASKSAS